ncbi:MAG: 50S ribosomal protein L23 [Bdellovibrionaceae bacterium]|nr:50S ribosomal protein L23 [Pseudobdellovibrionaceae bacterium]
MNNVIKAPLVTEKNTYHSAAGVYVFEVEFSADKTQIRTAVEKNFGVKVDSVRTAVCRGHSKYTKFGITKAPYWKKAFVKLKAGEKIALFEGV